MDTDKSHSMATGTFKKPLRKKVRRGGKRHSKRKHFSFSLLGNNVAGLQGKAESLDSLIKYCAFPSCITLQETKLGSKSAFRLNGYQVFQKNRNSSGGGLLTAVDPCLNPSLISSETDAELITVQLIVNKVKLRVINKWVRSAGG